MTRKAIIDYVLAHYVKELQVNLIRKGEHGEGCRYFFDYRP